MHWYVCIGNGEQFRRKLQNALHAESNEIVYPVIVAFSASLS